jgi:hypothetical protein
MRLACQSSPAAKNISLIVFMFEMKPAHVLPLARQCWICARAVAEFLRPDRGRAVKPGEPRLSLFFQSAPFAAKTGGFEFLNLADRCARRGSPFWQ